MIGRSAVRTPCALAPRARLVGCGGEGPRARRCYLGPVPRSIFPATRALPGAPRARFRHPVACNNHAAPMQTRLLLRTAAGIMALAILVLWAFLVHYLFRESGQQPAPAVLAMPLLFVTLGVWALVAAIRDEPVYLLLAGGLSFIPIGLFLLFMPGVFRWIGILDLGVVATGVLLLRLTGGETEPLPPPEAPGGGEGLGSAN